MLHHDRTISGEETHTLITFIVRCVLESRQRERYKKLFSPGVTGICVSQGCVFPAHISLGMHVSPHTYH